ncbi:MAG: fasciclin domain-containing protein [Prolixibacteraceae bacterium]
MKRFMTKHIIEKSFIAIFFLYLFSACYPDVEGYNPGADELVIAQFIQSGEDSLNYTEFNTLLLNTELNSFLSIRGPYTLFLPNNAAMQAFYAAKGYTSADDMDLETQRKLVLNHLVLAEISAGDIGLGAIRQTNAIDDKLATEFSGSDIIINKVAKIIDRDTKVSNGYVHVIDHVLEPVSISIYELLASKPEFSLFKQGIDATGIKDTLNIVDFDYGTKKARTYFTLLAVPDTIFNRYGIYTLDDMINKFDTLKTTPITDINNGFYQYIEYHCLTGSQFLSDFVPDPAVNPQLYPILSYNNNVQVKIADDYMLNFNSLTGKYTGFLIESSNVPAKNGALHAINDLLVVVTPEPTLIIFDTCDYFDVKQGDYYMKYYKKWYDGENTFKNIHWAGDYIQYYYKNHDAPVQINYDGWEMIGYWWIEVTTPKIMKGKYSMTGYVWGGRVCDVYVDGVKVAHVGSADSDRFAWGDFTFDTTTEHKVKLVSTAYSTVFWDTIELTPLSE